MRLAAMLLLSFILAMIYGSAFLSFFSSASIQISPSILILSMLFNLAIMGGGGILVAFLLHGSWSKALDAIGFKSRDITRSIFYGIIAALAFIFASSLIISAIGYEEENPLAEEIASSLNIYILFLLPTLSALSEEIFFRGLIQNHLEKGSNCIIAILATSMMFSLAHIEYKAMVEIIATFSFSIVLGYLMHKTKNIASPITAHFIYNFIALLPFYLK